MQTQCPHCKKTHNVSDAYEGKQAKCSSCKQPFTVRRSDITEAAKQPVTNTPGHTCQPEDPGISRPVTIAVILTLICSIALVLGSESFSYYIDSIAEKQLAQVKAIRSTLVIIGFIVLVFGLFVTCLLAIIARELKRLNQKK